MQTTNIMTGMGANNAVVVVQMSEQYVLWLSLLATTGLSLAWAVFWLVAWHRGANIAEIISRPELFRIITVMGVIAATAVLSLTNRIDGNLTGAILSGIVGYVLGSVSNRKREAPPVPAPKPPTDGSGG